MTVEETAKTDEEHEIRNRSYSPLSQDFKSQDSGFSDSERSDCSKAYENATPRRKLRKKRMRRRIQSASPWLEEGSPPMPTHTSTPKDSRTFATRNRFGKPARTPSRDRRWAHYYFTLIKKEVDTRKERMTETNRRLCHVLLHFKYRLSSLTQKVRMIGSDSTRAYNSSERYTIDSDINNFNVMFRNRVATDWGNRHRIDKIGEMSQSVGMRHVRQFRCILSSLNNTE